MKKLAIKKETVVKLFTALGFKTSGTWDNKRLKDKIKQLPELVDGVKIKNPKTSKILKAILDADEVTFKDEAPERPSEGAKSKPTKEEIEKAIEKKTEKAPEKKTEKVTEKKTTKKTTEKPKKEKSTKQRIYECFLKVKPEKAQTHAEKWWEENNKTVQLSTIKSWIGQWKSGKALPAGATEKKAS